MGDVNLTDILELPTQAAAPSPLADHSKIYARNTGGNEAGTTVLLVHMNGGEGSTAFVDDSDSGHTITAIGGVTQSAGISKFGTSVLKLDGGPAGAGEHISIPDDDDFFFAGDFTIDQWIRPQSAALGALWGQNTDGNNRIVIFRNGTSITVFVVIASVVGPFFSTPAGFSPLDHWIHVAVERMGTSWYIYINGVPRGNQINAAVLPNFTSAFTVGQALLVPSFAPFVGFFDEFRVSKGVARYGGAAFATEKAGYDSIVPFSMGPDGIERILVDGGQR